MEEYQMLDSGPCPCQVEARFSPKPSASQCCVKPKMKWLLKACWRLFIGLASPQEAVLVLKVNGTLSCTPKNHLHWTTIWCTMGRENKRQSNQIKGKKLQRGQTAQIGWPCYMVLQSITWASCFSWKAISGGSGGYTRPNYGPWKITACQPCFTPNGDRRWKHGSAVTSHDPSHIWCWVNRSDLGPLRFDFFCVRKLQKHLLVDVTGRDI